MIALDFCIKTKTKENDLTSWHLCVTAINLWLCVEGQTRTAGVDQGSHVTSQLKEISGVLIPVFLLTLSRFGVHNQLRAELRPISFIGCSTSLYQDRS